MDEAKDRDTARTDALEDMIQAADEEFGKVKERAVDILKLAGEANSHALRAWNQDILCISTSRDYSILLKTDGSTKNHADKFSDGLSQCVITTLLDPAANDIIDSTGLHTHLKDDPAFDAHLKSAQVRANGLKAVEGVLRLLASEGVGAVEVEDWPGQKKRLSIVHIDRTALKSLQHPSSRRARRDAEQPRKRQKVFENVDCNDVDALLNYTSVKEHQVKRDTEEISELLGAKTAKQREHSTQFKSRNGPQITPFCPHGTVRACKKRNGARDSCEKIHFLPIIQPHTNKSLGDCSYLDTCRNMNTCKFVHYVIDPADRHHGRGSDSVPQHSSITASSSLLPPQWINCDVRKFDFSVLGNVGVIMADPPWDIHMELPYGTMKDNEMRQMNVQSMQTEGLFFLWVTGRAMELGRELFQLWGYRRVAEIVWVKTNQLQRLIRTGRTGHWLNHSKEHCLVGIKGSPKLNRSIDCDVVVSEVRETSRKPDEIYSLIERISPGTTKVELFGRPHNCWPGWITLGNQLDGVKLHDTELKKRYEEKYGEIHV